MAPPGTALPNLVARAQEKLAAAIAREIKSPAGFTGTLFATPAVANYPVFVAATDDGAVYVSSDGNGSLGRDPHRGRVLRLRDTDGDDLADEYILIFTDLGNIEHALHGLNWAPDGRLYMSKGNSKGLVIKDWKKDEPDRIAPKPFRDLWGVPGPKDAPDFPSPKTFTRQTYKSTYHDPEDDWGR